MLLAEFADTDDSKSLTPRLRPNDGRHRPRLENTASASGSSVEAAYPHRISTSNHGAETDSLVSVEVEGAVEAQILHSNFVCPSSAQRTDVVMAYPSFNSGASDLFGTNFSAIDGSEPHPSLLPGPVGASHLAAQQR